MKMTILLQWSPINSQSKSSLGRFLRYKSQRPNAEKIDACGGPLWRPVFHSVGTILTLLDIPHHKLGLSRDRPCHSPGQSGMVHIRSGRGWNMEVKRSSLAYKMKVSADVSYMVNKCQAMCPCHVRIRHDPLSHVPCCDELTRYNRFHQVLLWWIYTHSELRVVVHNTFMHW